jgi:hypothetical protein
VGHTRAIELFSIHRNWKLFRKIRKSCQPLFLRNRTVPKTNRNVRITDSHFRDSDRMFPDLVSVSRDRDSTVREADTGFRTTVSAVRDSVSGQISTDSALRKAINDISFNENAGLGVYGDFDEKILV